MGEYLLPTVGQIESELSQESDVDQFGGKILLLANELKRQDIDMSIWAVRLLLYEKERIFARKNLVDIWHQAPAKLRAPNLDSATIVGWNEFIEELPDKSAKWVRGSFRSVPTPMHVLFLSLGMFVEPKADLNVLLFESSENIKNYKPGLPVMDDKLRHVFLSQIPGLDGLVKVPEMNGSDPGKYWEDRVSEIRSKSKLSHELVAPDTIERGYSKPDDVMRTWNLWEGAGPEYWNWSTSHWDNLSGDYSNFEKIAMEYLLD